MQPISKPIKSTQLPPPTVAIIGNEATEAEKNSIYSILLNFCHVIYIKLNKAKNQLVAYIVLPSLLRLSRKKEAKKEKQDFLAKHDNASNVRFSHKTGPLLDGVEITQPQAKKWIVIFQPNADFYESNLEWARQLGKDYKTNVFLFNYRGVGESQGSPVTPDDLVEDGITALNYVKSKGANAEDIALLGHSLGGSVGVLSLAHGGEEFKDVSIIADRTFKDLPSAAKDLVGNFAEYILKNYTAWQMDTKEGWKKIKGKKVAVFHPMDDMISKEASLSSIAEESEKVELEGKKQYKSPHNVWIACYKNANEIFNKVGLNKV